MANTGEPFDGRAAMMRESPWMAAEDIEGMGEVTLTIEGVMRHKNIEFELGRKKDLVYAIKFKDAKRQLVLNASNRKALCKAFGMNTQAWRGKRVELYLVNAKLRGETVRGVRVRPAKEAGGERNKTPRT